jgi:hypothetical protein
MQPTLAGAIEAANLLIAAYAVPPSNLQPTYVLPAGLTVVQSFFGHALQTDSSMADPASTRAVDSVSFGFVAQRTGSNDYVVVIRGTQTIYEWVQDARFLKVDCPYPAGSGQSEDGFTDVYSSLRTAPNAAAPRLVDYLNGLPAGATLTITGHSLGAALATLLALDVATTGPIIHPTVYTLASPNVGDPSYARTFNGKLLADTWRITVFLDVVPHLPPTTFMIYANVGQDHSLNSLGQVSLTIPCLHAIQTYLHLLAKLAGSVPLPPLPQGC